MAKAADLGVDDVVEVVRDIFGLDGDVAKGEFRTLCPVHELGEQGHKPSCDINIETGYWNCFSCPASGDLVDLGVAAVEKVPFEERQKKTWKRARSRILRIITPSEPDAIQAAIKRRARNARRLLESTAGPKGRFKPIIPSEENYEFRFPKYLKDRGFTKETLKRWNIRYAKRVTLMKEDGKSFELTHAVCIPIYDPKEVLIGWCYRATEKSESWFRNVRYIYTPGITDVLSKMWFGMHLHKNESEIAIVEGALDAIWCDQNGIPALAILGSQVKQLPKLRALMDFRKIVLLTDRDSSGAITAHYLGSALIERGVHTMVCRYPSWMLNRKGEQAGDAQDLCGLDLELVYVRAVPFVIWRRGNRLSAA